MLAGGLQVCCRVPVSLAPLASLLASLSCACGARSARSFSSCMCFAILTSLYGVVSTPQRERWRMSIRTETFETFVTPLVSVRGPQTAQNDHSMHYLGQTMGCKRWGG